MHFVCQQLGLLRNSLIICTYERDSNHHFKYGVLKQNNIVVVLKIVINCRNKMNHEFTFSMFWFFVCLFLKQSVLNLKLLLQLFQFL